MTQDELGQRLGVARVNRCPLGDRLTPCSRIGSQTRAIRGKGGESRTEETKENVGRSGHPRCYQHHDRPSDSQHSGY